MHFAGTSQSDRPPEFRAPIEGIRRRNPYVHARTIREGSSIYRSQNQRRRNGFRACNERHSKGFLKTVPRTDPSLVAVPLPSEEELTRVIGKSYDSNKTLNVIKMFAGTDDMYPAVVGFIKAIFQARGVNPKLREMIVLRVAAKYHVLYEWQAQSTLATNVGLSLEEIQAAASDDAIESIDADYRLAWQATDEICVEGTLRDETLQQLLARHGDTMTRKIILIISWFNLLSCFINGCRVPLEAIDKIGNESAPVR